MANITVPNKNTGDQHTAAELNQQTGWANSPMKDLGAFNPNVTFDSQGEYNDYTMASDETWNFTVVVAGLTRWIRVTTSADRTLTLGTNAESFTDNSATTITIPAGTVKIGMGSVLGAVQLTVPKAPPSTQLTTPTLTLAPIDLGFDYTISNEDPNATDGIFEYDTDAGFGSPTSVPGYVFATKTGSVTGLVNGTTYYARIKNTATGYTESEYSSSSVVAGATFLSSLQAYWKLDETSGSRADSHSTNTLTDNHTVLSAAGIISTAALFNAANSEYLSIASNSSLQVGDIDFTISAWVYLTDKSGGKAIVTKFVTGLLEYQVLYGASADRFHFRISHTGDVADDITVDANILGSPSLSTWYNIIAYHDSVNNEIGISVNDGTADTTATSNGAYTGTGEFNIGAKGGPSPTLHLDGRGDETGFWKRLLTPAEKTALYNAGAGLTYPFS